MGDLAGRLASLLAVLALIAGTAPGRTVAGEEKTVAVLPFHNSTGRDDYEPLEEGMVDILSARLGGVEGVAVVDRSHMMKILREQELSLGGPVDAPRAVKVGKLLGADMILTGGVLLSEDTLILNGHLYDVETTRLIRSEQVQGSPDAILEGADELLAALVKDLDLSLLDLSVDQIDESPVANLHFIRGLGYYYASLFDHALMEFMNALTLEAGHGDARFWLARSYFAQEEWGHAVLELDRFLKDHPSHDKKDEAREMAAGARGRLSEWEKDLLGKLQADPAGSDGD